MTDILRRLDCLPLKRLHGVAALLCAVAFGIDLMGVSITTALSAVFSAPPYALTTRALSWLLASVYVGAVIGSPVVGWIADRQGLQRTLAGTLLLLGVASLLAAARADPLWFGGFRLLSGVALGAFPPLMIAYLTATSPPAYRGLTIFWVCGVAYIAPPLGVFMLRWLTPIEPLGIEGWRWPFLVGGVAAIMTGIGFAYLPESVRWLMKAGRTEAAERVTTAFERSRGLTAPSWMGHRGTGPGVIARATPHGFGRTFAFVLVLYGLQPWALVAFPLLTGPILLKRGHSLSDALLYVAIATVGPVVATFLSGIFVDRIERRLALVLGCILMLIATGVFIVGDQPTLLAGSVIAFSIGVATSMPVMTMYGAELFPTSSRASATSLAWAANRLAAVLVPLVMFPLFLAHGAVAVGLVVAGALGATIGHVGVFGPRGAAGNVVQ
jgi:putative MFS transporter